MTSGHAGGLKIEREGDTLRVTLPDSITMDNHEQIETAIEREMDEGVRRVVVDLDNTRNIYSSGFGLIVRFRKRVAEIGAELTLVNATEKVVEGLEGVGLNKLIPTFGKDETSPLT